MEFIHLVFTCTTVNYRRRVTSLLLCLCDVFWVQITLLTLLIPNTKWQPIFRYNLKLKTAAPFSFQPSNRSSTSTNTMEGSTTNSFTCTAYQWSWSEISFNSSLHMQAVAEESRTWVLHLQGIHVNLHQLFRKTKDPQVKIKRNFTPGNEEYLHFFFSLAH